MQFKRQFQFKRQTSELKLLICSYTIYIKKFYLYIIIRFLDNILDV